MHPATVQLELSEASVHLQRLVADLRAGRISADGDAPLGVELAHVLDHLCRAWNCKDQTPEQHAALSPKEFEQMSHTVPNFLGERAMGEFAFS